MQEEIISCTRCNSEGATYKQEHSNGSITL